MNENFGRFGIYGRDGMSLKEKEIYVIEFFKEKNLGTGISLKDPKAVIKKEDVDLAVTKVYNSINEMIKLTIECEENINYQKGICAGLELARNFIEEIK